MLGLILDTLFPAECMLCGKATVHSRHAAVNICSTCVATRFPVVCATCPNCHRPIPGPEMIIRGMCKCCDEGRWGLNGIVSIQPYHRDSSIRPMLLGLKHRGQTWLARDLAILLSEQIKSRLPIGKYDGIVAVPLHPVRERKRGYNQAALIGQWVGRFLNLPFLPRVLRRTRRTTPQKGDSRSRRLNISGAFEVAYWHGSEHLILVDDVFTTGATTRECARNLIAAGCESVSIATCAWAPPKPHRNGFQIKGEVVQ